MLTKTKRPAFRPMEIPSAPPAEVVPPVVQPEKEKPAERERPAFKPMEIAPAPPAVEMVPPVAQPEEEKPAEREREANVAGVVEPVKDLPSESLMPGDSQDSDFQPTMLTFEQVCHWLSIRPAVRKYFVNARGEYVRKWIEEYDWMTRPGGGVIKIPKWFGPEVMDPKTGLFSPYDVTTTTQGSADRI